MLCVLFQGGPTGRTPTISSNSLGHFADPSYFASPGFCRNVNLYASHFFSSLRKKEMEAIKPLRNLTNVAAQRKSIVVRGQKTFRHKFLQYHFRPPEISGWRTHRSPFLNKDDQIFNFSAGWRRRSNIFHQTKNREQIVGQKSFAVKVIKQSENEKAESQSGRQQEEKQNSEFLSVKVFSGPPDRK